MNSYQADKMVRAIAALENHPYYLTRHSMYLEGYMDEAKDIINQLKENDYISETKQDAYIQLINKIPNNNESLMETHYLLKRLKRDIYNQFS